MANKSGKNKEESLDPTVASSHQQPGFSEEIGMEALSKKALEETKREGGAFASENANRFRT